jgi:amino acid adenylation domain-containing protein/non-ribosomal peptide synthase protein (TIGR01720 family)
LSSANNNDKPLIAKEVKSSSNAVVQIPITSTQNLILTGQQLQPNDPLYNMIMVYRIAGEISPEYFRLAFSTLVKNCDAMRLVYTNVNNTPKQQLLDNIAYDFPYLDFSQESAPFECYRQWENKRKTISLNLAECLFESALIKLSSNDYIWYFNQHHLATDAWSTELTYNYLKQAYELAKNGLIQCAIAMPSYAEYAYHEEKKATSKQFVRATKYWVNKLDRPFMPSKFYRAVPANKSSTTLRHKCEFGQARTEQFRQLLKKDGFAAFSTDLGLMQLFATMLYSYLHRISGNNRLSIGTPCHSRTTANLKQTAGLLINIFPLQIDVADDDTFLSLYQKVAQANQELLINALPGASQASHNNAFDVVLNYITASFGDFDGHKMATDWVHPDAGDRNHLMRLQVHNFDNDSAITLFFDLNIDAFQGEESEMVLTHFLRMVDAFLADPNMLIGQPPLINELADQKINRYAHIVDANKQQHKARTVLSMWEDSWRKNHLKTSLILTENSMSFDELNRQSDMLARHLLDQNMINHKPIAVFMERSIESVVTILGILKAGGSFLPIDVHYPESRTAYILADAKVALIITSVQHMKMLEDTEQTKLYIDKLWSNIASSPINISLPVILPESTAYIIYTSGSTGQPKGVEVTHSGLHNYLNWAREYYLKGTALNFPLFSSLSFDLTVTSIFLPLISGGKLVIYPESEDTSIITIRNVIEDNRVDIIKLTPAHLMLIQNMDFSASILKKLVVGGDDFKTEVAQSFDKYFAGNIELYNEYGPTEATVACTVHRFNPFADLSASVPIGMPIDNALIYLLDSHLNAVPQGVVGEIYIGGIGLAKGYLDKPELTNERFIYYPQNRHPQKAPLRLYKTGDLATFNDQGVLEYLGRNDHQVKIRGVRIETGEIEAAMLGISKVNDVIVDLAARFGLHDADQDLQLAVEHCKTCGIAANHPSAQLDEEKICRICRIYEKQSEQAQAYYQDLPTLQAWIDKIKVRTKGKQDSIMLLSGGKDSSYTLCKLVDMGLTPIVFTLDNGYISDGAKANIKRLVDRLGLELVVGQTDAMDDIFVDSLTRFSNVCNGCFKTIYTMSMKLAKERGISVICTGLSRGQIFETRVAHLFQQGCFSPDKIDERIIEARKAYHRTDDIISRRLDVQVFQDDDIFEQIQYLDYFRYTDVTLDEMYEYLNNIAPWIRPSDTGRSTNCLINDAGIYVHKKERGYHNYALPYSWDVRLGHKERDAALDELDDEIDQQKVDDILKQVGYQYQKPNAAISREDALVAYYAGPAEIQKNTLQSHLALTLPKEYIPSQFIWLKELPLTANGKIDRDALPKPQQSTRELTVDYIAPSTEVETTLAKLWGQLLGVKEVGIADNFFDLGGDSIVNIQIVAAARESGIDISPQQVFDYPTIQSLAEVAGTIALHKAEQGQVEGECQLLPAQIRFFEAMSVDQLVESQAFKNEANTFVRSVTLQYEADYSTPIFQKAFQQLLKQHDGLRTCFTKSGMSWQQKILAQTSIEIHDLVIDRETNIDEEITQQRAKLISQIDICTGKAMAVANMTNQADSKKYLLIVIHQLVVDGVSWWVLLSDLAKSCQQISKQQAIQLPAKSCSVVQWSEALETYKNSRDIDIAKRYWKEMSVPQKAISSPVLSKLSRVASIRLSEEDTQLLSHEVPAAYSVQVPEVLLAALAYCEDWFCEHSIKSANSDLLIDIEGHGREDIAKGIEVMRTVGWFTSVYPVVLSTSSIDVGDILRATKEYLRAVPNKGIDYGLLRYVSKYASGKSKRSESGAQLLLEKLSPNLSFNYMGQWERTLEADSPFAFYTPISSHGGENTLNAYALEITIMIFDEQLQIDLSYDATLLDAEAIDTFAKQYKQTISEFIHYCMQEKGKGATPSDFPSANIGQDDLEDLFAEFGEE